MSFWELNRVIVTEAPDAASGGWGGIAPSGDIFVEIGFGNGEFLEYLGRAYPDVAVVGIEVSQLCASKGARRVMAADLSNVRIMHGDARFLIRRCFEPSSVSRVFMNYPCPWPKSRHASRRVTVPAFADLLGFVLTPGGTFELATDVEWYAKEAADSMRACSSFEVASVVKNPVRPYVTKYERKWKAMNKDTWLLSIKKSALSRVSDAEAEEWPMQLETDSARRTEEILGNLKDSEGTSGDGSGRWVMRETFISPDGIGLVLVITSDEGFEQHFYIKVIPKNKGFTVKIDSVGHPYRTPAMRAALMHVLKLAGGV